MSHQRCIEATVKLSLERLLKTLKQPQHIKGKHMDTMDTPLITHFISLQHNHSLHIPPRGHRPQLTQFASSNISPSGPAASSPPRFFILIWLSFFILIWLSFFILIWSNAFFILIWSSAFFIRIWSRAFFMRIRLSPSRFLMRIWSSAFFMRI